MGINKQELFFQIRKHFLEDDPIGLVKEHGAPIDEYNGEIIRVMQTLYESDSVEEVDEAYCKVFGEWIIAKPFPKGEFIKYAEKAIEIKNDMIANPEKYPRKKSLPW